MARIYSPRQRLADGRWDMCVSSDDERWVHPAGYCHARAIVKEIDGLIPAEVCAKENARTALFEAKYHADGHSTPEEARACYRTYCLDQAVRVSTSSTAELCLECREWTPQLVMVGPVRILRLCEKHQSRELLEKHFEASR